jgi:hypothetical protein
MVYFIGVVAQLVERRVRNAKVRGSIPLSSTNFAPVAQRIARPPPKGKVAGSIPARGAN